jgi:two-component system sensor histidine kinase MprB
MRANLDLLAEPGLSDEERRACLTEIRNDAEDMSVLISDLLILSRQADEIIHRTTVDYTGLCRQVLDRFRRETAGRLIRAEIEEGVTVQGDREMLGKMLGNLLQNAQQYTPAECAIELELRRQDGGVALEVRDSGPGFGPEDLQHVFERFYRGAAGKALRPDGSGLGLAIVKHIAESHGGCVTARNRDDGGPGAVLRVDIPEPRA